MQKQQQQTPPIFNLEPGGMIGVTTRSTAPVTAGFPKIFLLFVGILAGLTIGIAGALIATDKQIAEAKDTAKLEQLRRLQLQDQIKKICDQL